jgi:hypothetical protein
MRKKDEEVIKKVVDKIIDSKVLLTGDGDFYVTCLKGEIMEIIIRNLFSPKSKICGIAVKFNTYCIKSSGPRSDWGEFPSKEYGFRLWYNNSQERPNAVFWENDLDVSPSFKRLVEYIEENKHLILYNDKEYGRSHTLTDADFI